MRLAILHDVAKADRPAHVSAWVDALVSQRVLDREAVSEQSIGHKAKFWKVDSASTVDGAAAAPSSGRAGSVGKAIGRKLGVGRKAPAVD